MSQSLSLPSSISIADPDRLVLPTKASLSQNASKMKPLGIALIIIGAVGAILAAAAIVVGALGIALGALPAVGVLGMGITFAAICITTIAIGIFFNKRSYWHDQEYIDKQSKKAMSSNFDQIIKELPWDQIKSQHIISKKALQKKFFDAIQNSDYRTVVGKYKKIIDLHGFIKWSDLKNKLQTESVNLDGSQFKAAYGDQPCQDQVIEVNDAWYKNKIEKGVKGLTYNQITTTFAIERRLGILTDKFIAEVLPYDEIVAGFGWQAIRSQTIISSSSLIDKFFQQIKKLTYKEVIQKISSRY